MKKLLLRTTLLLLVCAPGVAQKNNFWSVNNASRSSIVADKAASRQSYPVNPKLFNLNFEPFKQELFSIVGKKTTSTSVVISLPNAEGGIEEFELVEGSNFDPVLQAQFPEIRAYSGRGITDKSATVKLSISPQGIQTMVFRSENDNEFIEPYSKDHTVYSVYSSHREKGALPWNCSTEEQQLAFELGEKANRINIAARSTGDLKTFRLAQSVTAEYSNYFGATSSAQVSTVLAAINNTLTRCNGVYEKDLAIHLNLIAETPNIIYYNPSTDPYSPASTGAGGAWNKELQSTLTSVIGEANYDIGHLFGATGGGGNAGCIGCVCTNGSKGSGYTSPADGVPQGDYFDIDYVVHEIGHQLGANHTFSMGNEGTGVNKEVGSGITIMGYAGITSQDVAPHSIDIFHHASIAQIQTNLTTKTCPITSGITNATPAIAPLTNYTIPKSTPFALTGSATDANPSDQLTYCWEQNDNASSRQTGTSSVASETKATGPNWISFKPTSSPTRYFPQLSTILKGARVTGPLAGGDAGANTEALSSVARTLNFRLTVRDNAVYSSNNSVSVGQTNFRDMVVTVASTSGPFVVSVPNTAVNWQTGSFQTISWDVAGTTATPINCADVKISLSTDGGLTFPVVLMESTPNDGTEVLQIPNTQTTTARIKVEAVGNIFFDISNTNFTITGGTGCGAPSNLVTSGITATGATVSWTAVSGALNYDVDYKASSAATWTNAATRTAGTSITITGLANGTVYDWRVRANCSSATGVYSVSQFTTGAPITNCQSSMDNSTNDNIAGAASIPLNTDVKGVIASSADVDNYKFDITTAGSIAISIRDLPANYDLALLNASGTQITNSKKGGTNNETINYSAQPGTYYAKVYPSNNVTGSTNCYTLKVQAGAGGGIIARAAGAAETMVSMYPNPVGRELRIDMGGYNDPVTVTVIDMYGRRMINKTINGVSGISTLNLAPGVYLVTVTAKDGRMMKQEKIIKE